METVLIALVSAFSALVGYFLMGWIIGHTAPSRTMHQMYGDNSSPHCIACDDCGCCRTCGDCECLPSR